jgi:hypothetical protein
MRQRHDELTPNVAERRWREVASRDETRIARRLPRTPAGDGVCRLDEGAVWDEFCRFLRTMGVMARLEEAQGAAIQRDMVPSVQDGLLDGLKTLVGIKSMHALPLWLCSDEALLQLVGFKARHVRQGVCQRGATTRQRERTPGPISPETLANTIVQLHWRDLERVCKGAIGALAQAGVFDKQVTGMADGPDLETTARDQGGGPVTRQVRLADKPGQVHAIEVTVDGWNVLRLIEARTKLPLAAKLGPIQEHETHGTRALVTQARATLAGHARLPKVVCDRGLLDGTDLWWLDQQGLTCVVPAKSHRAVTADARAQAVAGGEMTVGRRAHSGRHGPGKTARTERLETEVVGITALTTDDQ